MDSSNDTTGVQIDCTEPGIPQDQDVLGTGSQSAERAEVSRRQFLKMTLMSGAGLMLPKMLVSPTETESSWADAPLINGFTKGYVCTTAASARPPMRSMGLARPSATQIPAPPLTLFSQPLRGVGPGAIPVAIPDGTRKWGRVKAQHYTIDINQYSDTLHPALGPTTLRGYNPRTALGIAQGSPVEQKHLGGIIVGQRDVPIQITFQNNLPAQHILPVDTTIMGADGATNRTAVHLHGGLVPWISDGGPFTWFDPDGNYGESIIDKKGKNLYKTLNPNLLPGQAEYYYPNAQSARFVWYHDHAVGITRLNAYAGIASGMLIRDSFEANLRNRGLPDYIENGGRELPIVIQEKFFQESGALGYPSEYPDTPSDVPGILPLPETSIVPEMFGDTMLANGVVYPFAAVDGARYRLRVLNACQARFLNLQLYVTDDGVTVNKSKPGPDFLVLGTEGGFLSRPTVVPSGQPFNWVVRTDGSNSFNGSLITAPAERWDIIVDFKGFAGKQLILYNDAPAPFPDGDPACDYNTPGSSPNTRVIMRFDVGAAVAEPQLRITSLLPLGYDPRSGIDPSFFLLWTTAPLPVPRGVKVRQLTLNELNDAYGRLIQMLGTNKPNANLPWPIDTNEFGTTNYAREYMDPATEVVRNGAVEVWQIANLTGDTHPMHFHLANAQILSRQPFNVGAYNGQPSYTGPARGPDRAELGWKDTVKMHPGEVTTVMMQFSLPKVPFIVPPSPRTGGHEFVWHCHILEHEEHDMMRPLIIQDGPIDH
jgi:spore coat protein A